MGILVSKPKKKCEIIMELGMSGGEKFTAVKAGNKVVTQEEANRFLHEARLWLDKLAESWNSCYLKSDEEV